MEFGGDPRSGGAPVLVDENGHGTTLERIQLFPKGKGFFDEAWLQRLIDRNPSCLPISDIDPASGRFQAVCTEMPTAHGPIDNLLMTPDGQIAIVETKLFRNHTARRDVLAQALDYAVSLFSMTFEDFQTRALRGGFNGRPAAKSLYEMFSGAEQPDEAMFIDTIVTNLKRGRILIVVAGDGIRAETELLLSGLLSYAQFQFTLALVELAVYRMPGTTSLIVRPRTLAKTGLVKRYVFELTTAPAASIAGTVAESDAVEPPGSDGFWRELECRAPGARVKLESLIRAVAIFGVYPEFLASLNLKWQPPDGSKPINLGYITKKGAVWLDAASWFAPRELAAAYVAQVAEAFGTDVHRIVGSQNPTLWKHGSAVRLNDIMNVLDRWQKPIEDFIQMLTKTISANDSAL